MLHLCVSTYVCNTKCKRSNADSEMLIECLQVDVPSLRFTGVLDFVRSPYLKTIKHKFSETESVSVLRSVAERRHGNRCSFRKFVLVLFLGCRMMENVQNPNNSEHDTQ
jgi:hypothetical protein